MARGDDWAVVLVLFVVLWVDLVVLGVLFVPPLAMDALVVIGVCLVAGLLPGVELVGAAEESMRLPVVFFVRRVSFVLGILQANGIAVAIA